MYNDNDHQNYSSNSIATFEKIVNERYEEDKLVDGYADFCKHIFIENDFTDAQVNILPITSENEHCLRTKYEARNDREVSKYFVVNDFSLIIYI